MAYSVPPVYTVLVATPTPAFGDLIRHSLEESGMYRVVVVSTARDAQAALSTTCCQIAILDSDLSDSRMLELAPALQHNCPNLKLVLIPPENDPGHPTIKGIPTAGFLDKPFYLPDLVEMMNNLTGADQTDPIESHHRLDWINQPILDRLLATTSASAGAVAQREGHIILGGSLPQGADSSLSVLMGRFWQREEHNDLVRFARLDTIDGNFDCLIYLTVLNMENETAVSLIYPINTPLSKVRLQAGPLLHALRELSAQNELEPVKKMGIDESPSEQSAEIAGEETVSGYPLEANESNPTGSEYWDDEGEMPVLNLAQLLGTIPSPDPNGKTAQSVNGYNGWIPESAFQINGSTREGDAQQIEQHSEAGSTTDESAQPSATDAQDDSDPGWEQEDLDPGKNCTTPPLTTSTAETTPIDDASAANPLPSTHPLNALTIPVENTLVDEENEIAGQKGSVLTALTSLDQLEPASPGLSLLNYTCILVPRMPQHYLTGDLSDKIGQWVHQLCLAFGWRLEGIALRPEYLQWTVQVAPTISPGNVVKIVRQRSSDMIFSQFESLRQQNPSGDFWAIGYLIVSGSQPPSAGLMRDYIQQTRRRQGIVSPPGETAPRLPS